MTDWELIVYHFKKLFELERLRWGIIAGIIGSIPIFLITYQLDVFPFIFWFIFGWIIKALSEDIE